MAEIKNYYGVWYPYENFDIGNRFFFFESLREAHSNLNSANNKSGADLASEVSGALSRGKMFDISNGNNKGLELVKQVLDFLQKTIQYEKNQEIQYFKDKFENSNNMPDELKKQFKNLFKNDSSFDYLEFINLINILSVGRDHYKTLLNREINRLKELQTVIEEFIQAADEHYTEQDAAGKKISKGFYSDFSAFLSRQVKNSPESKLYKRTSETKTFSNAVQTKVESVITALWREQQWKKELTKLLNTKETLSQEFIQIATVELMNRCIPIIKDQILSQVQQTDNFKSVINADVYKKIVREAASNYLDSLSGKNNKQLKDFIDNIKSQIKDLKEENLSNDTKRYVEIVGAVTVRKKKSKNNDEEVKETISIANETEKILREILKQKEVTDLKNSKDELLKQFVEKFGTADDIQALETKKDLNKISKLVKDIVDQAHKKLPPKMIQFHIAARDNLISEAFANGNFDGIIRSPYVLRKIGLAGGYQKADVFGVENIKLGDILIALDERGLKDFASNLAKEITESYFDAIEIQVSSRNGGITEFDEQDFREHFGFKDHEFSIEAETKRRLAALSSRCEKVKQALQEKSVDTEEIDKCIKELQNTIQISTTVKSYNKYNNKEGFHGGSLGGTVEHQLANIYKMYDYGGITMDDIDWMTFAVYNSGNNMLGAKNKEPIERFLSAAAGMLLFDDAGEEALYIQHQAEENYTGSSRFLHLYNLNDFYFPSSYILQLTYNGLMKAYGILEQEFQDHIKNTGISTAESQGATIKIENKVSEPSTEITNWKNFFSDNFKKVSVNIVFLAGLLDIIELLNSSIK